MTKYSDLINVVELLFPNLVFEVWINREKAINKDTVDDPKNYNKVELRLYARGDRGYCDAFYTCEYSLNLYSNVEKAIKHLDDVIGIRHKNLTFHCRDGFRRVSLEDFPKKKSIELVNTHA